MHCPVCKTTQLTMSERQGVEIDYCPQCRGIWLDRGELDKILERSAQIENTGPIPTGSSSTHHDSHRSWDPRKGGHRKKSFLEELFD